MSTDDGEEQLSTKSGDPPSEERRMATIQAAARTSHTTQLSSQADTTKVQTPKNSRGASEVQEDLQQDNKTSASIRSRISRGERAASAIAMRAQVTSPEGVALTEKLVSKRGQLKAEKEAKRIAESKESAEQERQQSTDKASSKK